MPTCKCPHILPFLSYNRKVFLLLHNWLTSSFVPGFLPVSYARTWLLSLFLHYQFFHVSWSITISTQACYNNYHFFLKLGKEERMDLTALSTTPLFYQSSLEQNKLLQRVAYTPFLYFHFTFLSLIYSK